MFTAISPSGHYVVLLTVSLNFYVFTTDPVALACAGEFRKQPSRKAVFKYKRGTEKDDFQFPLKEVEMKNFSAVAISDEYLAIGGCGRVMMFLLDGNLAGRWIFQYHVPGALIERLKFSPNGAELLVLLNDEQGSRSRALVFSSGTFPKGTDIGLDREEPTTASPFEIQLGNWDTTYSPGSVAWSLRGDKIAICTTAAGVFAEIRLLKKSKGSWKAWGAKRVQVLPNELPDGQGFTGISLYCFHYSG